MRRTVKQEKITHPPKCQELKSASWHFFCGFFVNLIKKSLTTRFGFEGQKYFANTLPDERILQETEILREAKKWLDVYFTGEEPPFTPPLHPAGSTFRQAVWQLLLQIPYGQTFTYGEIARRMAEVKKVPRMSAQAVGGAVGHNEISIIIPCHRVVGTNGSLTGYGGGIDKKISLLNLEHADMSHLFIPKKRTAL